MFTRSLVASSRRTVRLTSSLHTSARSCKGKEPAPPSPAAAKLSISSTSPSPGDAERLASTTSVADLHPLPDSVKAAGEPSPAESNVSSDGKHSFPNLAAKNAAIHESRPAAPGADKVEVNPKVAAPGLFQDGQQRRGLHTVSRGSNLRFVRYATTSTTARPAASSSATPAATSATKTATSTPRSAAPAPAAPPTSTSAPPALDASAASSAAPPQFQDWLSTFAGMSTQPFEPRIADILSAPIDEKDIEIKPDGLIYLPEIKYRRILNKAFGPGGWGLAPRGETNVGPKIVSREWALVCLGRFVSTSRGEQEYFDPSGIATASEGAKSNALMRCCKDLGIASELWDPRFIREFKAKHGVEVWAEGVGGKKKKLWRRKDQPPFEYPWKEKSIA